MQNTSKVTVFYEEIVRKLDIKIHINKSMFDLKSQRVR